MSNQTVDFATTVQLLDGRRMLLRRLSWGDAAAVVTLHQHLTKRDRYFRFFTLCPVQLDRLANKLIQRATGQYALGAFVADRLIGIANYSVSDDPSVAEIALVVAHEDHLCGVGTALLKNLTQIASRSGIRRLIADIVGENRLMLKVLSECGLPLRQLTSGPVCRMEVELAEVPIEGSRSGNQFHQQGVRNG
jgi:GNAT superfamily N-acetyltransferase